MEKFVVGCRRDPLNDLTAHLMKDIESFVADTPRSDDITMLLLRRES
jgi:serine phosphatase RsbU (regulator of sigma subunit)